MTPLRRLDHVAVLVRDTDEALRFYSGRLGLAVASSEEISRLKVRLTYLDAGNAYIQLVQPLADSPLAVWLDEHGEGLHHICFGVDDVAGAVGELSDPEVEISIGTGRGRVSSFVSAADSHGVRIECTEFVRAQDVDETPGYLDGHPS